MPIGAPPLPTLAYDRVMKWFISLVVIVVIAGGAYLATQPRLDARCVAHTAYDRLTRGHPGWQCIHYAARRGDSRAVTANLDAGVAVDLATDDGRSPLMLAAANGQLRVLHYLLNHQAEADRRDQRRGWSALHWAARGQHPAVVRALVAAGADVTLADRQGRSPLSLAAEQTQPDDTQIAHTLIAAGARPDRRDKQGDTPILLAAQRGNLALVRYLISLDVDVDSRGQTGMTPLFAAINHQRADIVRALLAAGAAPDAQVSGVSPLARALQNDDRDIAHLLRANGAEHYRRYAVNAALERGDIAFISRRYADAVAAYSEAIHLAPDNAAAYAARAQALIGQAQTAPARQDLAHAIQLAPNRAEYPTRLARLQLDADQPDAAIQTLRRALARLPDAAALPQLLATARHQAEASRSSEPADRDCQSNASTDCR